MSYDIKDQPYTRPTAFAAFVEAQKLWRYAILHPFELAFWRRYSR